VPLDLENAIDQTGVTVRQQPSLISFDAHDGRSSGGMDPTQRAGQPTFPAVLPERTTFGMRGAAPSSGEIAEQIRPPCASRIHLANATPCSHTPSAVSTIAFELSPPLSSPLPQIGRPRPQNRMARVGQFSDRKPAAASYSGLCTAQPDAGQSMGLRCPQFHRGETDLRRVPSLTFHRRVDTEVWDSSPVADPASPSAWTLLRTGLPGVVRRLWKI